MSISLTIACGNRDLSRFLLNGEVEPDGVDATVISEYPPKRHRRFFRNQEFDVSEVSIASYLSAMAHPDEYPFTAIPVFPNRRFRHAYFYKHTDADIDDLADLEGKKVGMRAWQTTANVWMRGIAGEHYDLDLEEVQWYRKKQDDVLISLPDNFDIHSLSELGGETGLGSEGLKRLFFDGKLDAVMDPSVTLFHAVHESDDVEFMFDDPLQEERDYFEKTGIHPPMHTVAIRDEVLEENPWVAVNIYEAFCESRDKYIDLNLRMNEHTLLTWAPLHLLEQKDTLGLDTFENGLTDDNRRALRKFIEYGYDQGLTPDKYDPEDLFFESTIDL